MKDNFSRGIYPTLEQRQAFAFDACSYVRKKCHPDDKHSTTLNDTEGRSYVVKLVVIISFSFVNNDLREVFRSNFPDATWILVDTSILVADERIRQRDPDHFYKGNKKIDIDQQLDQSKYDVNNKVDESRNNEWNFDKINFSYESLNGLDDVKTNATKIVKVICKNVKDLETKSKIVCD